MIFMKKSDQILIILINAPMKNWVYMGKNKIKK